MSAQSNRDRFPGLGGFVDDFKKVFGPGVKVRYASNLATGDSVGKPGPVGVAIHIPPPKEAKCPRPTARSLQPRGR